jgi:hypothetical protein
MFFTFYRHQMQVYRFLLWTSDKKYSINTNSSFINQWILSHFIHLLALVSLYVSTALDHHQLIYKRARKRIGHWTVCQYRSISFNMFSLVVPFNLSNCNAITLNLKLSSLNSNSHSAQHKICLILIPSDTLSEQLINIKRPSGHFACTTNFI